MIILIGYHTVITNYFCPNVQALACIWSFGVCFFGFDWTSSKMVLGFRIAGAGLGSGTVMGGKEVVTVAGLLLIKTREGTGAWPSTLGLPRETHREVGNNLDCNRKVIGSIATHISIALWTVFQKVMICEIEFALLSKRLNSSRELVDSSTTTLVVVENSHLNSLFTAQTITIKRTIIILVSTPTHNTGLFIKCFFVCFFY